MFEDTAKVGSGNCGELEDNVRIHGENGRDDTAGSASASSGERKNRGCYASSILGTRSFAVAAVELRSVELER